ncbi:MAG: SpoIVB peptidase [Eubacteriales bacterium]|nr:SpoIVB peptidase [Eubacteriales bacterium]
MLCMGLVALNFTEPLRSVRMLSGDVYLEHGESLRLPFLAEAFVTVESENRSITVSGQQDERLSEVTGISDEAGRQVVQIKLLGLLPVKTVTVHVQDTVVLVPGGDSIGVTLHTKGALVVGVSTVDTQTGQRISPAVEAGLQAGDVIEAVNGVEIKDAAHLSALCNLGDSAYLLTVLRQGKRFETEVHPLVDTADGRSRLGIWVRDSTAGVGTLSFYDPSCNKYAALGHAITDVDTNSNLTVREGEILQSSIVDIVQGAQGEPGELRGTFGTASLSLGNIERNTEYGIYGSMYQGYYNPLYPQGILMGYPDDAVTGPAELLTTLSDEGIAAYDCEIIKVNPQSSPAPKGLVIEITDEELLQKTGGIVQGMSGSPLLQNGRLIGVVTHVFVNDPTKGYCMYTDWMRQIATQ